MMKRGFTLVEVLITLSIIGVIAAMTIPSLLQRYYVKQTISRLNTTYSLLVQACKMAELEYGDVETWGLGIRSKDSAEKIAQRINPFLKIGTDCGTMDTKGQCSYTSVYKLLNGSNHDTRYYNNSYYYKVILLNGASIWWRSRLVNKTNYIVFFTDINGKLPPNTVGKDLFVFEHIGNNTIIPSADNDTLCNKTSQGWGCADYIFKNHNMDYLYK